MKIDFVTNQIQGERSKLIAHTAFTWVDSLPKARWFMENHVWAVWDFMVLLKALQRGLTCVDSIWVPKGDPAVRRLINEIVFGEESDIDQHGNAISHFELYVQAMGEAGANTDSILSFIEDIKNGIDVRMALRQSQAPEGARKFVLNTLDVVDRGDLSEIAAVFTFGREDLIPDMFMEIVGNLKAQFPEELGLFAYYLERHIEVDGDLHGHLAEEMVLQLCGGDREKWDRAASSANEALKSRIALWDAVVHQFEAVNHSNLSAI